MLCLFYVSAELDETCLFSAVGCDSGRLNSCFMDVNVT